MSFVTVLNGTLPVYLMMLVGALVRRLRWMPPEADAGVMMLCVRLLTPCLALERIVGNPALNDGRQVLLAAVIGYMLVAVSIALCLACTPLLGLKKGEGARTFALATGLQNYGFVAIPVVQALFGQEAIGVLFTFSLGVELALWTIGVGLLTGLSKAPWRHAINPPVIGIVSALILHYAGAGPYIPPIAHTLLGQLGGCAIPLSVVLIGATISDFVGLEPIQWKVAIASPVLRLLILPWAFYACAKWLPMSDDLKRVLCVQGAMPTAVFTVVMARIYHGHSATAVQVILATTLFSLFSTPFSLGLALDWVGVK